MPSDIKKLKEFRKKPEDPIKCLILEPVDLICLLRYSR